jgi:hypothetical protein
MIPQGVTYTWRPSGKIDFQSWVQTALKFVPRDCAAAPTPYQPQVRRPVRLL